MLVTCAVSERTEFSVTTADSASGLAARRELTLEEMADAVCVSPGGHGVGRFYRDNFRFFSVCLALTRGVSSEQSFGSQVSTTRPARRVRHDVRYPKASQHCFSVAPRV